MSAFNASGGIPLGPTGLPDLRDLMALVISVLVGGLVLMSRSSVDGEMSGEAGGAGLLSVSLKCLAHLAVCSSSPKMVFRFLSLTGRLGLLVFTESVRVISYSLFIFLWPAVVSASSVSSSMNFLLSFLTLFFTC